MIHIVNAENRHLFHHALMEMHRQRKSLFIDTMGWNLDAPHGLEIDAFDSEDTTYLIDMDHPRGEVRASARLLPSGRAHLLSEVFSELCPGGVPRGDLIWEASRFCPAPSVAKGEPRRACLARMIGAILETGILFGVEHVTFVASAALAPLATAAGWEVTPLGPSRRVGRDRLTAFSAVIDAAGLKNVRSRARSAGPLTRFVPGAVRLAA